MFYLLIIIFLAGIITAFSPSVFATLPSLLSLEKRTHNGRPIGVVVGLLAGFSFFTFLFTTLFGLLGGSPSGLRYASILLIGCCGLAMITYYLSDLFGRWTTYIAEIGLAWEAKGDAQRGGFYTGLLLGGMLGLVWVPLVGFILAALTTLAVEHKIESHIILMTLAFSLGVGISFLVIAYGHSRFRSSPPFLTGATEKIRTFVGWFLLMSAIALAFNLDVQFDNWVTHTFPEAENPTVPNTLQQLKSVRPPPMAFPNVAVMPQVGDETPALPKLGLAPAFVDIDSWINTDYLPMAKLKGRVVVLNFWSYNCIQCQRMVPFLVLWYNRYQSSGLVVMGIHTPHLQDERNIANVRNAVKALQIPYPIAVDNNSLTAQAYHVDAWPSLYLIDRNGVIRLIQRGVGNYEEFENGIRELLEEPRTSQ